MSPSQIPAPDRDLANVEPRIPPVSDDTSPVTRAILGSITIAMGVAIVIVAISAAIFQASPLPTTVFNSDEILAAVFAGLCGLCLIGCGRFIFRRSLGITAILLLAALICGYVTSTIT